MNISYNWLKEYLDFDLEPEEVAAALTSIGLETGGVEEVQTIKGGLEGLVIGEVLTCEEHPNSDHLHITTVNVGGEAPLQIVCGAPNVAAGQKVVVAVNGTKLYDGDECFTIKRSKIRGVESNGMICAEDEIGIGTDHNGIIVLPADAVVGTLAKDYYNVKSDYVLEVDITPNRVDATSHFGVARDLAAYLKQNGKPAELRRPSVDAFKIDDETPGVEVVVENTEACPRYSGVTIKGVTVKESPEWLQNRLRVIGLRPINNVVDITNFILHELGQPLHSFDAGKIKGNKVIVKAAEAGTKFVTLDGVERTLTDRDLMICNVEEPMCIGGVFGGLDSGVTEETTDVFLESACFHPTWIRKTARRFGLNTDASFRFERGLDPNNTMYVLKRAALLIQELAGGKITGAVQVFQNTADESVATLPDDMLEENRQQYETFRKAAGDKLLLYFDKTEDAQTFITETSGLIPAENFHLPEDWQGKKLAIYATPEEGAQVITRDVELIKDENNPFYDANRAAKQALSFFIVKHCSVYFLPELVKRGMLADAQTKSLISPERGKAIIQENWKFLARYFIREYPNR